MYSDQCVETQINKIYLDKDASNQKIKTINIFIILNRIIDK